MFFYTSLIEPHLTHCIEVWGNAYKSNLHPLYVKQRRVIPLVSKTVYQEHTAELLKRILVMWLECRFLDTEVDGSNPSISMLCPWARHFICIASVDSAVKWVPGGDNLEKGVQCYELFRGIALKNHTFLCTCPWPFLKMNKCVLKI